TANNLKVSTTTNTRIIGDVVFKNMFNKEENNFVLDGNFQNLSSNYNDLTDLLPNILGPAIPTVLSKVGNFNIVGSSYITAQSIKSDVDINTDIGFLSTNLNLTNTKNIDNANYKGKIIFTDFNLGELLNDPKVKEVSSNLDVDGKGFTLENLNTQIVGEIYSLDYNNYIYEGVNVIGNLGNSIFNGKLIVDDPNLKLDFNGLADLSEDEKQFDFNANVGYANLKALNFVERDSISEFNGLVDMRVKGSTLDNAVGSINIKRTTYKNQDSQYKFEDFDIVSSFLGDERTITINSPDIIEGRITGKFQIKDIAKLVENSVGSIYTNYIPNDLQEGQYLDFNFNIYSKIVTVFYKDLILGENTFTRGRIESDAKGFKFTFNSPEIKFKKYFANDIAININNSNPLFNTFIEIDTLSTGVYSVSQFNLINVTKRDTLLVKTEFKGGQQNMDDFDLNMFYTIDKDNRSVVGFRKSDVLFKGYDWVLNSEKDTLNKIVFDRQFKELNILPMRITHENEEIELSGTTTDSVNKNFDINFKEVELVKITPRIDSLSMAGLVNGYLNITQKNGAYFPKSDLVIDDFVLNNYELGILSAKIEGNNSLTAYGVDLSLINDNIKSLEAKGELDVSKSNSRIDVDVKFEDFLLDPLNPLGEGVINNIRGLVSGEARVTGNLNKPNISGRLMMDRAGLAIPYLNVDYNFDFDSEVILEDQRFIFNNVALTDSKYFSRGYLNGFIEHNNFSDWKLGLDLETDRLLVLNTTETEESLYYGTGFISGTAEIYGPTNQLTIDVEGKTSSGTVFNIPLNDIESFGDNSYIHFLSPEEKAARENGELNTTIEVKGLELNFELDVDQNALIEIVIDKESGSTIKGTGEGNLVFLINTNGRFNMWGDFSVFEGIYNFKYQGIVEKRFEVEQGGHIEWEGDPMKAQIDIKAIYKTQANPSVLLDNPISQNIPVEVEIHLTGQLEQPNPEFNFRFPNVTSTVKSELDYRLSSKEDRDNQALILLATGGFASGVRDVNISGTIAERLNGIINSLFGTGDGKFNVGLDLEIGQDNIDYQTDDRFGITFQTQISDKVLFNGKVGVPFGSASQTVIAGDAQIDLLLNDNGTLRAKVFNRENSIRNFGEEIGYTQGLGLSYNVEFDTFKELLQIIFSGKNRKPPIQKEAPEAIEKDSTQYLPEYISMKKKSNEQN
ncbi:MAG: translocation/assembly module TamB, partial [Winogradskyella sp.]|nr:translocation/assembly module TamB [Winogradskyella sp.]